MLDVATLAICDSHASVRAWLPVIVPERQEMAERADNCNLQNPGEFDSNG